MGSILKTPRLVCTGLFSVSRVKAVGSQALSLKACSFF
jgi:hypothetical protein